MGDSEGLARLAVESAEVVLFNDRARVRCCRPDFDLFSDDGWFESVRVRLRGEVSVGLRSSPSFELESSWGPVSPPIVLRRLVVLMSFRSFGPLSGSLLSIM